MLNVFKKMIRKEFGAGNYERYCGYIYGELPSEAVTNKKVYEEMYRLLSKQDMIKILFRIKDLDFLLTRSYLICRNFPRKALMTVLTVLLLLMIDPPAMVLYPLLLLAGAGFVVVLLRYLSYKFRYVDIHLIFTYRAVLEKLAAAKKISNG